MYIYGYGSYGIYETATMNTLHILVLLRFRFLLIQPIYIFLTRQFTKVPCTVVSHSSATVVVAANKQPSLLRMFRLLLLRTIVVMVGVRQQ